MKSGILIEVMRAILYIMASFALLFLMDILLTVYIDLKDVLVIIICGILSSMFSVYIDNRLFLSILAQHKLIREFCIAMLSMLFGRFSQVTINIATAMLFLGATDIYAGFGATTLLFMSLIIALPFAVLPALLVSLTKTFIFPVFQSP